MRSVLMLTYHFPPSAASGSFRLLGFARHLPKFGWAPTVVSPPSLPWEPIDPALCDRLPPECKVVHANYKLNRLVRKFAMYAGWLPAAERACRRVIRENRPEVLLTSGPPHQVHWLGYFLSKRFRLPWVADFRDPWFPEGRMRRGRDFASWRVAIQENAVLNAATAVVANAPNATRSYRESHPHLGSKFITLPNGYDLEAFQQLAGPPPADGRPLRVVHSGAIYVGRDPRPFFDALQRLNADGCPLEAEFFGPAPESDLDIPAEARARGIGEQVRVRGQVAYAQCLREIASADILLLLDSPGRTVGVPAKVYEYLGAGRPILALGEATGDLAWVLSRSGVPYRIARPDDPGKIASCLRELVTEALEKQGEADSDAGSGSRQFSRETITGRLADILGRCSEVSGRGQGGVADLEFDAAQPASVEAPRRGLAVGAAEGC